MNDGLPALTINQDLPLQVARLEERSLAAEKALTLHTQEMMRRLEELNHAHKVREERDKGFVSVDKYEGLYREFMQYRDQVNKTLHELEGRTAGMGSARNNLFQVIGVGLVMIGLAASIIFALLSP